MLADEIPTTEVADEIDEMTAPSSSSLVAPPPDAGEEKESSVEEFAPLTVDDSKVYPRVPVTNARKVFLPHTYVMMCRVRVSRAQLVVCV